VFDAALMAAFYALGLLILFPALRGGRVSQFPLFYGYIIYLLVSGVVVDAQYYWAPAVYPTGVWFRLLLSFVAEFAVIAEVSDHIFSPYPALRQLGRFLTLLVSLAFFFLYILPPFLLPRPSDAALIDLTKRSALTKGAIIVVLLAAARIYRLKLNSAVSGLLLGFTFYLATKVANCALVEAFGWGLYGKTFSYVFPLSFLLAMLVWTVAFWHYQPALVEVRRSPAGVERVSDSLGDQLEKANTALIRLLEK
jgi:hypothetical protein